MKRYGSMALVLLLLTGCGAEVPSALPETAPIQGLSAPAAVTEGRAPEADYALPTEVEDFYEWMRQGAWGQQPVGLLAELPEQDAALYGVHRTEGNTALLRWGDSLAAFDWSFGGPLLTAPQFQCLDIDQDGQDEVVFVNPVGSGTGVSIDALHIVEKNADGTLTDYCLPDTLFEDLTAAAQIGTAEGRTFAALGTELVDITSYLTAEGTPPERLVSGSIVHFRVDPAAEDGVPIRFQGSAWLEGEGYPPTVWYAADLSAAVTCQDGVFTLSDLHLNSL